MRVAIIDDLSLCREEVPVPIPGGELCRGRTRNKGVCRR